MSNRGKMIGVKLPDELDAKFRKIAEQRGEMLAPLASRAVMDWLACYDHEAHLAAKAALLDRIKARLSSPDSIGTAKVTLTVDNVPQEVDISELLK